MNNDYNIGDLVEFIHGHLGASIKRTGIVIDAGAQRRDKIYKIRAEGKDYWISAPRIEMLSKVVKASSK